MVLGVAGTKLRFQHVTTINRRLSTMVVTFSMMLTPLQDQNYHWAGCIQKLRRLRGTS